MKIVPRDIIIQRSVSFSNDNTIFCLLARVENALVLFFSE